MPQGLYRLEFLNLDGNNLSRISEDAFQDAPRLEHLLLSNNPLADNLQHLDLFSARPSYVDLSRTRLVNVPQLIARNVRDLRLSGICPSKHQKSVHFFFFFYQKRKEYIYYRYIYE